MGWWRHWPWLAADAFNDSCTLTVDVTVANPAKEQLKPNLVATVGTGAALDGWAIDPHGLELARRLCQPPCHLPVLILPWLGEERLDDADSCLRHDELEGGI